MKEAERMAVIEALLFAIAEPIEPEKISDAVGCEVGEAVSAIEKLKTKLEQDKRGIRILKLAGRYQMSTADEFKEYVEKALDNRRNTPLSQAALEVLSIIAYNQPVSRSFIDRIRGVDSSSSVANLLSKDLITEAGRLDLPGRPVSFKTTDTFLRCFGLSDLTQLPPVHQENLEFSGAPSIEGGEETV